MSVTIHTDVGDLKIELYCEEAPKACENFLALAGTGQYNKNIFHRNMKGFIVQTGDPTNKGKGGKSIWGGPFPDEITPKFHHKRGIISMANKGANTNQSQFFIMYAAHPHLDGKNTIFGHVIDGFDVLDELESCRVDAKFRPLDDVCINTITIHANPLAL